MVAGWKRSRGDKGCCFWRGTMPTNYSTKNKSMRTMLTSHSVRADVLNWRCDHRWPSVGAGSGEFFLLSYENFWGKILSPRCKFSFFYSFKRITSKKSWLRLLVKTVDSEQYLTIYISFIYDWQKQFKKRSSRRIRYKIKTHFDQITNIFLNCYDTHQQALEPINVLRLLRTETCINRSWQRAVS